MIYLGNETYEFRNGMKLNLEEIKLIIEELNENYEQFYDILDELFGRFFEDKEKEIYDSGYDDGYNEGYNNGYDEGYTDGYDEGYSKGYDDAYMKYKNKCDTDTVVGYNAWMY